jgi:hypothetical protein
MKPGLQLTLTGPDGIAFRCDYSLKEHSLGDVCEIARRLMARQKRHYILAIEPCDEPPPLMTMEQWIAAGHTKD